MFTWMLFVAGASFWFISYNVIKRTFGYASLILLAFLVVLLAKHGINGRSVGGIQPNLYARVALIGLVLAFFLPRWLTCLLVCMSVGLMILVSSRDSLLGASIFLSFFIILSAFSIRSGSSLLYIGIAIMGLLAALGLISIYGAYRGSDLIGGTIENVLALNDQSRGFGSGFTGRSELWSEGLRAIVKQPFFGYGFRRQIITGHNGYILLMSDVGIPMSLLFFVLMLSETIRRIYKAVEIGLCASSNKEDKEIFLLHRLVASYLVCVLVIWVFEPEYIRMGTPMTVLLSLFLVGPYNVDESRSKVKLSGCETSSAGSIAPVSS